VLVPLSVQSAARSTPAGPAPPQELELWTSTSGTGAGCSGSAADTQTAECFMVVEDHKLTASAEDGWTVGCSPWRRCPPLPLCSSLEVSGGSAGFCCVVPATNKQQEKL